MIPLPAVAALYACLWGTGPPNWDISNMHLAEVTDAEARVSLPGWISRAAWAQIRSWCMASAWLPRIGGFCSGEGERSFGA